MNKGDCFILDTGKVIYVYYGVGSKKTERIKAVGAANQIRDQDHSGRTPVKILGKISWRGNIKKNKNFFLIDIIIFTFWNR